MKVQLISASHLEPLEGFGRTKYPGQKLVPGEIIFSRIEKNYCWFLPEIRIPEPAILHYVLSDLIWNCKENNISLVLLSFSNHVVFAIKESIRDLTLSSEEVNFWWADIEDNERVYRTLRLK